MNFVPAVAYHSYLPCLHHSRNLGPTFKPKSICILIGAPYPSTSSKVANFDQPALLALAGFFGSCFGEVCLG